MPTRSKSKPKQASPAKKKATPRKTASTKAGKALKLASQLMESGQAKTRSSALKKAWKQVA